MVWGLQLGSAGEPVELVRIFTRATPTLQRMPKEIRKPKDTSTAFKEFVITICLICFGLKPRHMSRHQYYQLLQWFWLQIMHLTLMICKVYQHASASLQICSSYSHLNITYCHPEMSFRICKTRSSCLVFMKPTPFLYDYTLQVCICSLQNPFRGQCSAAAVIHI